MRSTTRTIFIFRRPLRVRTYGQAFFDDFDERTTHLLFGTLICQFQSFKYVVLVFLSTDFFSIGAIDIQTFTKRHLKRSSVRKVVSLEFSPMTNRNGIKSGSLARL